MYRQGDVLLVPVAALPADLVAAPRHQGRIVLAEGETTGHAHYVADLDAALFAANAAMRRFADAQGVRESRSLVGALRIGVGGATLWHGTPVSDPTGPCDADHNAIALPAGDYLVITPREYADADEFRRVAD